MIKNTLAIVVGSMISLSAAFAGENESAPQFFSCYVAPEQLSPISIATCRSTEEFGDIDTYCEEFKTAVQTATDDYIATLPEEQRPTEAIVIHRGKTLAYDSEQACEEGTQAEIGELKSLLQELADSMAVLTGQTFTVVTGQEDSADGKVSFVYAQ